MGNPVLDLFGKVLMSEVRDRTIFQWEGNIEGRTKSPHSQEIYRNLQHLDHKEKAYMKQLFSEVVDTTLHFLLSLIEENEQIDVVFHTDTNKTVSMTEISDGLAG